jgi:hypothetical protein
LLLYDLSAQLGFPFCVFYDCRMTDYLIYKPEKNHSRESGATCTFTRIAGLLHKVNTFLPTGLVNQSSDAEVMVYTEWNREERCIRHASEMVTFDAVGKRVAATNSATVDSLVKMRGSYDRH